MFLFISVRGSGCVGESDDCFDDLHANITVMTALPNNVIGANGEVVELQVDTPLLEATGDNEHDDNDENVEDPQGNENLETPFIAADENDNNNDEEEEAGRQQTDMAITPLPIETGGNDNDVDAGADDTTNGGDGDVGDGLIDDDGQTNPTTTQSTPTTPTLTTPTTTGTTTETTPTTTPVDWMYKMIENKK